ncbi:SNF2 family N-terminal domain-containing protein [Schizophyllum amplum]|uniref:SNF2 family N-terminal domain-containing protein n=1 Tax=Schizophyllum amplum TaxID=97359 RepID=A0A550CY96_9AGAR|nr:SNF2 family N-terminal domain-containing protein [Auriculariopsis ampla]
MPAFQNPVVPTKRKSEVADGPSAKRHQSEAGPSGSNEEYWVVQWRNPQTRKHKTWDEDGVLQVAGGKATLYDMDGKISTFGKADLPLFPGKNFSVGGKDLELDRPLTKRDFLSGSCFGSSTFSVSTPGQRSPIKTSQKAYKAFKPPSISKPLLTPSVPSRGIPLQPVNLLATSPPSSQLKAFDDMEMQKDAVWSVVWRKPVCNKNKQTWDGDAYTTKSEDKLTMVSEEGKVMGSTSCKGHILCDGYRMYIGGKEVRFDSVIPRSQLPIPVRERLRNNEEDEDVEIVDAPSTKPEPVKPIAAVSFYGAPAKPKVPTALHDPQAEDAVVMKAPTKDHIKKFNTKNLPVVPVVIDPVLRRRLRPHQIEGVKFLYECVMGLRKHEGQGCILADEMGLGKTLQTITLVWTLLKQNPYAGVAPAVQKVLIVCPVSLVNNWKSEFHKWLGRDRVGVTVCDNSNKGLQTFLHGGKHQQVLIIGYERLRTVVNKITTCIPPVGLIICDEGHRLKSANNKTTTMFKALKTPRRVILSGTPIQNDLSEFHAMADFCNPGLLDDYNTFRRVYEAPIVKSRTPEATSKEVEIGEGRLAQLLTISNSFVLRRDATLLSNYLPPKHEHIVFVKPTALQLSMYRKILHPDKVDDFVNGSQADTLALLGTLKKVSNSPILVKAANDKVKEGSKASTSVARNAMVDALTVLQPDARIDDMTLSGKLILVSKLLKHVYEHTDEKVVFVSHYTSALNILAAYCDKKRYKYGRLDGDTATGKRQEYVNTFNKSSQRSNFVFLLSSKAGGVGINLTGASRLILFDCDWNPSYDLQSAARCHRDGQKRPVHIYRLMTAGLIDEKIYQRQVTKLGLSSSLMGSESSKDKSDSFTRKDLRDLFRVYADTGCNTHDLLECPCEAAVPSSSPDDEFPEDCESDEEDSIIRNGFMSASQVKSKDIGKVDKAELVKKKAALASLSEFKHINCLGPAAQNVSDGVLRSLLHREAAVSAPKSQLDTLLNIDLETLDAMDASKKFQALPGGTVTYVFEKSSSTTPEDVKDDQT